MSEGAFFQDLAILMVVAGVVAAAFSRFGWPKAIGYILAGVVLSGNLWGASLLAEANVVTTPGAGFGAAGEGYVRISAFNSRENVQEAVERLKRIL